MIIQRTGNDLAESLRRPPAGPSDMPRTMRRIRRHTLMLSQVAVRTNNRRLDRLYILLQFVKFRPPWQMRNLALNITHRLKHHLQFCVLVFHKCAEMVDCFRHFIHTTSVARTASNTSALASKTRILICLLVVTARQIGLFLSCPVLPETVLHSL